MRAYHNTREETYRKPFGAVTVGGAVSLAIDVWDDWEATCSCRLWVDDEGESFINMDKEYLENEHKVRFTCTLKRNIPGIVWYSFIIRHHDISAARYGAAQGKVGGEGQLYDWEPPSFQLTFYEQNPLPDWYKNAIVYQIFPDRFRRGKNWKELARKAVNERKHGPAKALVDNWNDPPYYKRNSNGRIARWDFYGGTLSGIEEKLGYLEALGVTVLYLNPIFKAASNHRYDTADYMNVDEMLGGNEAFMNLAMACEEHGISIILDGVFNHTGCDSIYFNKYGNYKSVGAYQDENSPYRDWFTFDDSPSGYESWWGVDDLPNVNESNEKYRSFIFGDENCVVRHWLRLGAKGWRLDVADEMPDDFIEGIRYSAELEHPADAVIIGEVWEDASNKISYGKLRRYFLGSELDSAMNYPLRDALLGYLLETKSAWELSETLMTLYENYPHEAFYGALNLMGSHDRTRVMTLLGGAPDENTLSDEQKREFHLSESQRGLAKSRSWLMMLVQILMPGVPSIYYGDEAGMEGYSDPYNRGSYPWGKEDMDVFGIYRSVIALKKLFPTTDDKWFNAFALNDDVFGFTREYEGESYTILINRSMGEGADVSIPTSYSKAEDIACGNKITLENGTMSLHLYPMGSAVIRTTDKEKFAKPLEKGAGVICHITSVPNGGKPGNIGEPAKKFVDFLVASGQKYWQILPVNPTDEYGSPYAGASAYAANPLLLPESEDELRELYKSFIPDGDYERFCKTHEDWLDPYAVFTALRDNFGGISWYSWPERFKHFSPKLVHDETIADEVGFIKFCQYRFDVLWRELKQYANERGISIIGDMPMYVSHESADVWLAPNLFSIDKDGRQTKCAGVPPDYFTKDGQLWGNPLYNWKAMEADGYKWWMRRFERMFELYDYTRIDHFRGFESYWSVPMGKKSYFGRWEFGPGLKLFKAAHDKFGPLPVLAEDLGAYTPAVRALVSLSGIPGTDVMQFADGNPMENYVPQPEKVAYTGTHDNETLVAWCEKRYPELDPCDCALKLMQNLYESKADVVIITLQDALLLGNEARMNTPGVAEGNWSWHAPEDGLEAAQERLYKLSKCTKRS